VTSISENAISLRRELYEFSRVNGLSHIPSAASMLDYVYYLWHNLIVTPMDNIVIGKPFGAQAYYIVWKRLGLLDNIKDLSVGVKHDEIPFVDYGEETMGNALGVGCGMAMATGKRTWVNISDAALQMGNTLEAIQFIGSKNISNVFLTVDYNGTQVTDYIDNVIHTDPVIDMFRAYRWNVIIRDGHEVEPFELNPDKPNVVIFKTVKGKGYPKMEEDPFDWHYRKVE
jgi:transketolase